MREAWAYFAEDAGQEAGGRLERLKAVLRDGAPHLLVLDGLERAQAPGGGGRARGELEDPSLRLLLRSIAVGLGRTRALITSRFPMADLEGWRGSGYRPEPLDELDPPAARAVLQAWEVRGDDATLDALVESVGRHALSVSVLGSYVANFAGGDPAGAPLDLEEASVESPEAARLLRLLHHDVDALSAEERHLMARLAMFPRGVPVEVLGTLVEAGGGVAGVLVGCGQARLVVLLERLVRLGLVFGYGVRGSRVYTAHPFLRDYFREVGDVRAEDVHEVVRRRLASGLEARPGKPPSDAETLDRYEALVEHTRLAGKVKEAFDLYWYGIGGWTNLGRRLGDYNRCARILAAFAPTGQPEGAALSLDEQERSALINHWALFATYLGDLDLAVRCIALSIEIDIRTKDAVSASNNFQHHGALNVLLGRVPVARGKVAEALQWAGHNSQWTANHAYLAFSHALAGEVSEALDHFAEATRMEGEPLYGMRGICLAEFRWWLGDIEGALAQCLVNLAICDHYEWRRIAARLHTLLGQLTLPADPADAQRYLALARDWVARTGDIEVLLRAHRLASDIALQGRDLTAAVAEAEEGLRQADACRFGLYAIDLHLALARAHLERLDPRAALAQARQALDLAAAPDCGYAWGEADAAHLAGVAHLRLNEPELARRRLLRAVELRERIRHPRLDDSRAALARLDVG